MGISEYLDYYEKQNKIQEKHLQETAELLDNFLRTPKVQNNLKRFYEINYLSDAPARGRFRINQEIDLLFADKISMSLVPDKFFVELFFKGYDIWVEISHNNKGYAVEHYCTFSIDLETLTLKSLNRLIPENRQNTKQVIKNLKRVLGKFFK